MPLNVERYIFAAGAPVKVGIGFVVNETIVFAFKNMS
jgi:hypothetical protein